MVEALLMSGVELPVTFLNPLLLDYYMGLRFPITNVDRPVRVVGQMLDTLQRWCAFMASRDAGTADELEEALLLLRRREAYEARFETLRRVLAFGDDVDKWDWTVAYLRMPVTTEQSAPPPGDPTRVHAFRAWPSPWRDRWREVEVLGSRPLSELDAVLREALRLDPAPRSEFRVRGVRYGPVGDDPWRLAPDRSMGEPVASLRLRPGEHFAYIHDDRAWHEHVVEPLGATDVEEGVTYPRVVMERRARQGAREGSAGRAGGCDCGDGPPVPDRTDAARTRTRTRKHKRHRG